MPSRTRSPTSQSNHPTTPSTDSAQRPDVSAGPRYTLELSDDLASPLSGTLECRAIQVSPLALNDSRRCCHPRAPHASRPWSSPSTLKRAAVRTVPRSVRVAPRSIRGVPDFARGSSMSPSPTVRSARSLSPRRVRFLVAQSCRRRRQRWNGSKSGDCTPTAPRCSRTSSFPSIRLRRSTPPLGWR